MKIWHFRQCIKVDISYNQSAVLVFGLNMNNDLDIAHMRDSSDQVLCILKSMANSDRLNILCHLSQSELNVSEIEHITGIRQPTLSQQLMMLRKSDVVTTRREGKQIFYSIQDQKIITVLSTVYSLYADENAPPVLENVS